MAALDMREPIFILGTGRCGSTVLYDVLSHHGQVAWLWQAAARRPGSLRWHRLGLQLLDSPLPQLWVRKWVFPVEAYSFWDHVIPGFSNPCRDLLASDLSLVTRERARAALSRVVSPRRPRFLGKVTGWPRIDFLRAIFPDAKFIVIRRDGRAVANSLLNIRFWRGRLGPNRWRWGPLPRDLWQKWQAYDRSFVALAAIQWELLMRAMDEATRDLPPASWFEVRYERFCDDPLATVRCVLEFANLEARDVSALERVASQVRGRSTDWKWRKELTAEQQRVLQECLDESLRRYGYEPIDAPPSMARSEPIQGVPG